MGTIQDVSSYYAAGTRLEMCTMTLSPDTSRPGVLARALCCLVMERLVVGASLATSIFRLRGIALLTEPPVRWRARRVLIQRPE
jgi:hypothetical protein